MKKVIKFLTVLSFLGCVVACDGKDNLGSSSTTNQSPTSSQPIQEENPTKVVIAGPSFVEITKTIPLVADVVTSYFDEVHWESSDSDIASINEKGIVTGIKEGEAIITATSVKYPTLSATHKVSVTVPKITSISLFVEGNENVVEDSQTKFYKVPLGQVFYINYELTPSNGREPSSISYEVLVNGNASAETNSYSLEIQEDNRAKVVFYDILEGVEIVASARYDDYFDAVKKGSRVFNVFDPNIENNAKVLSKIAEFKKAEKSSLLSSSIIKERKSVIKGGTSSNYREEITHKSYSNASYVYKSNSDSKDKINLYHGINKNKYYAFLYDEEQQITEIYKNETALDGSELVENASLYYDVMSDVPVYGHNGILNNYLSSVSNISENIITFGNTTCYAYANYAFTDDQYVISSKYTDDNTGIPYDVKLTINLDKNNVIKGYAFEETLTLTYIEEDKEVSETISYSEKASNFVFGKKTTDSAYESLLDLNQYYYKKFDLVDISGTKNDIGFSYDYTNTSKYGADSVEVVDGIKKYSATYDKALVFKIGDGSPSTATTLIDQISSSSSNPDSIPNVSITSAGIVTINAKKDENNNALPGKSTFTFTSTLGYSCKIIVEFAKTNLKGLIATHIDESNDFGKVFKGDYSDYFFLNTNPDEDIYSFDIEIIEGAANGISLYHHVKNDLDDNPEFSYAIECKIVGFYKFKFYVVEDESIKTEQYYTITVEEPYTKEYLIEQLVTPKKVYTYSSGLTLSFDIEFTSDTLLTFTQTLYGERIVETINYKIEDGRIIIPETQYFKNSSFYFSKILGNKCPFKKDLSSIYFYLQMTADESYEDSDGNIVDFFNKYEFVEKKEIENLNDFLDGKTISSEFNFIVGAGMCTAKITFNDGKAVFVIIKNSDSSVFAEITMDYEVISTDTNTRINYSNVQSSNAAIKEIISMDYIQGSATSSIKIVFYVNDNRTTISFDL